MRRRLPQAWVTLLPSGTSSYESLHAEINRWWKNSPEQYSTTLALHLRVAQVGKLLAHNAALYQPTLRQVRQSQTLALALQGVCFSEEQWIAWLGESHGQGEMPLFGERCELKKRIAAKSASIGAPSGRLLTKYVLSKKPARDGMRRPAASKKPAASNARVVARSFKTKSPPRKLQRRTPFSSLRRHM